MTAKRPKLLDLFCGAGGAAMGYYRAGFEVVGVDIEPQPHFPFEFYQANVLTFPLDGYDAYHASPPCQHASRRNIPWRKRGYKYSDLIEPTRKRLKNTGKPYVIENVVGSTLINPTALNGVMFHLKVIRRRHFETNFEIPLTLMVKPVGTVKNGDYYQPVGHGSKIRPGEDYDKWPKAMGIDWMTRQELTQAIPPAYTGYIGKYLIGQIKEGKGET